MFFVDMVSAAYAQMFAVLVLLNSTCNHIFLNELHKLQHHPVLVYVRHASCIMHDGQHLSFDKESTCK